MQEPKRQPCDWFGWWHPLWPVGASLIPAGLRKRWSRWLREEGARPLDPAIAVAGFPAELKPWSWYGDGGDPPKAEIIEWPSNVEWPSGNISFTVEYHLQATSTYRPPIFRDLPDPTITSPLPFRVPVGCKGKWHVSYADSSNSELPRWVLDPEQAPACGSRTVELEHDGRLLTPTTGQRRSEYADRLCGNCLRLV